MLQCCNALILPCLSCCHVAMTSFWFVSCQAATLSCSQLSGYHGQGVDIIASYQFFTAILAHLAQEKMYVGFKKMHKKQVTKDFSGINHFYLNVVKSRVSKRDFHHVNFCSTEENTTYVKKNRRNCWRKEKYKSSIFYKKSVSNFLQKGSDSRETWNPTGGHLL